MLGLTFGPPENQGPGSRLRGIWEWELVMESLFCNRSKDTASVAIAMHGANEDLGNAPPAVWTDEYPEWQASAAVQVPACMPHGTTSDPCASTWTGSWPNCATIVRSCRPWRLTAKSNGCFQTAHGDGFHDSGQPKLHPSKARRAWSSSPNCQANGSGREYPPSSSGVHFSIGVHEKIET